MPASAKCSRACCWYSFSVSIEVSTEPRDGQQQPEPETPAPVPISTMFGARGGGEHGELRADGGGHRLDAEFEGLLAGPRDGSVSTTDSSTYFQFRSCSDTCAPGGSLTPSLRACAHAAFARLAADILWVFGLTFEKLLIIGVIAVFLLGPERLPHMPHSSRSWCARWRHGPRAKDRMREEMGPEFDDVDWKKLDPRQYDPRRIIREALLDVDPFAEPAAPVVAHAAPG